MSEYAGINRCATGISAMLPKLTRQQQEELPKEPFINEERLKKLLKAIGAIK